MCNVNTSPASVTFERLCNDLALPTDVKEQAWSLWQSFSADNDVTTVDQWLPLVIYTAVVNARNATGNKVDAEEELSPLCCTLSDILMKSKLTFIQFSEKMRVFRETVNLSEGVRSHLSNIEKQYCIISPLYNRFNREWYTVFREEEVNESLMLKKKCWTAFLFAKEEMLSDCEELIQYYQLLLCCINFIVQQTPAFQLNPPFDTLKLEGCSDVSEKASGDTLILQKLAETCQTNSDELLTVYAKSGPFFDGLLEHSEALNLEKMTIRYMKKFEVSGGLNELFFLLQSPHLQPLDTVATELSSACSTEILVSPVRAALNTIQQLRDIISVSLPDPLTVLSEHLKNCSNNPESSMRERVSSLRAEFVCEYSGSGQDEVAEQRFSEATNLYYRVMKRLLDMEKERLSQTDFSSLLNTDVFHRSLLACSTEIILMTYNVSWTSNQCSTEESKFAFPWILDVFGICAYDFQKVLECFVKAEPNLTREIIQHLTQIENKILDSIAWKSDSPVFEAISRCEGPTSTYVAPGGDHNPESASCPAEVYLSPNRGMSSKGTCAGQIVFVSPRKVSSSASKDTTDVRPSCSTTGKPSLSLSMFFNKVCRLGYHRLKPLCTILQVPNENQQRIWTCLEFCINSRTELLRDRHLDQMMLCSVYGICKVSDCEIKFKDIVKAYSDMPHAQAKVYKEALLEQGVYDSIIMFYNKVFMQKMKNYILQFARPVQPHLSPLPKPLNGSPIYSIPGRKNFYVSPLKESPFKSPSLIQSPATMTPRSRQLYCFGEVVGSAEKLKTINESIRSRSLNLQNSSSRITSTKRLNFDVEMPQSADATQDDPETTGFVIKKQRVNPPAAVRQPGQPRRNSGCQDLENNV